jgi:ABC-type amino acid transport substrate-binding protein
MATKTQHYDVFISYAKSRRKLTANLARDLEAAGLSAWWDTDVLAGDDFLEHIEERLEDCKVAVIIWTPESIKSAWVRSEANHALRLNKLINTHDRRVRIDQIPKPFDQFHSVSLRDRTALIDAIKKRIGIGEEGEGQTKRGGTKRKGKRVSRASSTTRRSLLKPIFLAAHSWLIAGLLAIALLLPGLAGDQFRGTEGPQWTFDIQALYLGRAIPFQWSYEPAHNVSICFKLQSARDRQFDMGRQTRTCRSAQSFFARRVNGTRYWRVRAVDNETKAPLSRWSDVIKVTQYDDSYERIKDTGKVRVLYATPQDQDIFRFERGEETKGFDVDFVQLIIKGLSNIKELSKGHTLQEEERTVAWKEVFRNLVDGKGDFAIASITKTEQRKRDWPISFSDTYFCTGYALIYRADTPDGAIRGMIVDKKVGVQRPSTNARLAEALAEDIQFYIVPFDTTEELTEALLAARMAPRIDFAITDTSYARGAQLKTRLPDRNVLEVREFMPDDIPESMQGAQTQEYVIAVHQRDDRLEDAINEIIDGAKRDDTLVKLFKKAEAEFEFSLNAPPGSRKLRERPWECLNQSAASD